MTSRSVLALAVSAIALTYGSMAAAQEAPAPIDTTDAAAAADQDDIVVTGTRTTGRSRFDSASPIDVLSNTTLQRQGTTELGASLSAVVPSIDFPRSSAVDGTDSIRPATLRGSHPTRRWC